MAKDTKKLKIYSNAMVLYIEKKKNIIFKTGKPAYKINTFGLHCSLLHTSFNKLHWYLLPLNKSINKTKPKVEL